ncbi:hypothetical protein [Achromobacter xylosoxidans]|uniref:hypothetical protein n=1 Tax=Alcaligenes xylosoxydans xylosoxydans TaxID=85698 RepID=UPI0021C2188F|nr:hypothetical protein [Achromobacter xylosoxidans]UXL05297.1 hypothetical protein N4T34_00780 [Achromobacter xylosoxidans]
MSITISFGWSGFGYKRGTLFGHTDGAPLQILKLGVISLVRFDGLRPVEGFGEFLAANIQLDEFLAERRPQVRQRLRRAERKAAAQAKAEVADRVEYWRACYQEQHELASAQQHRIYQLEATVKGLSSLVASDPHRRLSMDVANPVFHHFPYP